MSDETVSLPPGEVRESGLLLYWNERLFWPFGLTLKVAQWDQPESAAWRDTWALARAEVLSRMDSGRLGAADVLDLMEVSMAKRIRNGWAPGYDIQSLVEPDIIRSSYSEERRRALIRNAQRWLRVRRTLIRKRNLGG